MFVVIKAIAGKLALIISSIVLTLLLLEFVIRFFVPQPINHYNFTLIQADGGGDMVLGSVKSVHHKKPQGYGPYVPHLSTNFGGVRMTINSHGWRDFDYPFAKPEGVTRILVVGDSVTFGYGVPLEATFPKALERELNGQKGAQYQVMSLGAAGGSTYSQKNIIRDNVPIYAPDVVILAFNLNDILPRIFGKETGRRRYGGVRGSFSRALFHSRRTLDTMFRSRSHLYSLCRERTKAVLRKFAIASPTMLPLAAFDIESDYGSAAWRDTSAALLEIAGRLQKDKVKFVIAILPVDMQVSQQIADIYRREYGFLFADSLVDGTPQEVIKDFAERHGIACVDLLPAFRRAPEEKKFLRLYGGSVDWNHPNPLGHRIIAEELEKFLRAQFDQNEVVS